MTKTALITGITGQDGAYLAQLLLAHGYRVYGTYRRLSTPNFWRLHYIDIFNRINLLPAELNDQSSLYRAIQTSEPDEIYNLAAQSFVTISFEQPIADYLTNGLGVARILEVIRTCNPRIKFYQASTSELFGNCNHVIQSCNTEFQPSNPYAAAKLYGYWMTRYYRENHGLFASNGILFNHESPLRGLDFVTRKISNAAARISMGVKTELKLGNLLAQRDWGYAPEYVRAMWLMLQQTQPGDYIISTGESHTVSEFAQKAFALLGLNWQDYVQEDAKLKRPVDINNLKGDYSQAKNQLGWEPQVKFAELIEIMVKEDLKRWERWKKGEYFYWDALNYESDRHSVLKIQSE
jgi:GDPmannose 4,6-dehydratase